MSQRIRCSQCQEPIIPMTALMHWMKLTDYFWHEYLEDEITEATYQDMTDALQTFKQFAYEQEEKDRETWAKDEKEAH